jgi:signal peptidase I
MKRLFSLLLLAVLAAAVVLKVAIFDWMTVQGDDMLPTLSQGETYLVYKRGTDPARGDLIVFTAPATGLVTVRRVIGLPGDHIGFRDQTVSVGGKAAADVADGQLTMGGGPIERTLARFKETLLARTYAIARDPQRHSKDQDPLVVPPGTYYVLADNRNHGRDSREYGCVPASSIRGTVVRHVRSLFGYDKIE